jgi:hypothetical protein
MPTLNRFPLLGLWAEEAARRLGYTKGEAEALGHAYAVLYAIRARGPQPKRAAEKEEKWAAKPARKPTEQVEFGGDRLDVTRNEDGRVQGLVGGDTPQTPRSYAVRVVRKFPPGYYEKLQEAFRKVFKALPPRAMKTRLVYDLYDEWKKSSGVGRLVDLDKLLAWSRERAKSPAAAVTRGKGRKT